LLYPGVVAALAQDLATEKANVAFVHRKQLYKVY